MLLPRTLLVVSALMSTPSGALATPSEPEPAEAWRTTDRFDVMRDTATTLAERGPEGLEALLRLPDPENRHAPTRSVLLHLRAEAIVRALAHTETPTPLLVQALPDEVPRGVLSRVGALLPDRGRSLANALLAMEHPRHRRDAIRILLEVDDPVAAWGPMIEELRANGDHRFGFVLPQWSDEDRRTHADRYRRHIDDLLSHSRTHQSAVALRALANNPGPTPGAAEVLQTIIEHPGVFPSDERARVEIQSDVRALAMQAYVLHHHDPEAAIRHLVSHAEARFPDRAPHALRGVRHLFPDEILDRFIGDLTSDNRAARARSETVLFPGAVGTRDEALYIERVRARFGALLTDPDRERSRAATRLLHAITEAGPRWASFENEVRESTSAFPRNTARKGRALATLLAIRPDDPDVIEEVASTLRDATSRTGFTHAMIPRLARERWADVWVRNLFDECSARDHPLNADFRKADPRVPRDRFRVVRQNLATVPGTSEPRTNTQINDLIIEMLATNDAYDDGLAFSLGDTTIDRTSEQIRAFDRVMLDRLHAIALASDVAPLRDDVVNALLGVVLNECVTATPPPRPDRDSGQRGLTRMYTLERHRDQAMLACEALAMHAGREPTAWRQIWDAISADDDAITLYFTTNLERVDRIGVRMPEDAPTESLARLHALFAPRVDPQPDAFTELDALRLIAFARLPDPHPHVVPVLKRLTLTGRGRGVPPAALRALGEVRPMTDDLLRFIKAHSEDPRVEMRKAAVRALIASP